MKKIIFSFLLLAGLSFQSYAQQDATYNMYLFNALFLNPAAAGSQDVINLVGIFRDQWEGLDGAPRTANISVDAPLRREQYALGLTIANDRLGLTNSFSATAAFAYRIRIKRDNIISLGIQGGFTNYQLRNTQANLEVSKSVFDQVFSVNQNLWLPQVGAGIYAYGKRYFIGFSVPHLVPYSLNHQGKLETSSAVAHQYNQYLVTAGYVFGKEASIVKVRPSFLMTNQTGLISNIPDFDFNLGLLFIDRIWLIGGVTTGSEANNILHPDSTSKLRKFGLEGAIIMIQAKITPQLSVGYGYHYSISPLRAYETGTHEIMVGYQFWYDKKRFVTPRYVKYF